MSSRRLAIISTHPIQYYAPVFRALSLIPDVDIHVFYGWEGASNLTLDHEFGQKVKWDIPILDGYKYSIVDNRSSDPGPHHHNGIDCPDLIPAVSKWAPDAVLIYGWNYKSHLRALRDFHGRIPILFRGDSTLLDERVGVRKHIRSTFLRWVYRHVDIALYVGQNNRAYYQKHGLKDHQLVWAPHAIENDRFFDSDGAFEARAVVWREKLGILPYEKVLLYSGKLAERKGVSDLLMAYMKYQFDDSHLIFAGSGALENELREMSASNAKVHFLGFQNQSIMPVVYRLADILVLPSREGETWGLAVNEAMACGRSALVSDRVGCALDLILAAETGHIFKHQDISNLCEVLSVALDRSTNLKAMGDRALAYIENWSISEQAQNIVTALEQATAS